MIGMENQNSISEIINQTRKIEENNLFNMEYTNSISMMLNSNDLARPKDKELANKLNQLNSQMEDVNKLTSELLDDLARRHN